MYIYCRKNKWLYLERFKIVNSEDKFREVSSLSQDEKCHNRSVKVTKDTCKGCRGPSRWNSYNMYIL